MNSSVVVERRIRDSGLGIARNHADVSIASGRRCSITRQYGGRPGPALSSNGGLQGEQGGQKCRRRSSVSLA